MIFLLLACTPPPLPDCTAQPPPAPWGYAARWPEGPAEAHVDGQRLELLGRVTPHREGRLLGGLSQTLIDETLTTWGSAIIHDNDQKMLYHRATTVLAEGVARTRLEQVDFTSGRTCLLAEGLGTVATCGEVRQVSVVLTPAEACLPEDAPVEDCPPLPDIPDSADLAPFTPRSGFGFLDLPINGETERDQHRSHLRSDLAAVIQRAAMESRCRSQSWPGSNDAPLVLGDMSLADGTAPRLPDGSSAHPAGSHTHGNDVDVGYLQTRFFPDNDFRAVCPHWIGGEEAGHCTGPPDRLDVRRTALLTGLIAQWEGTRCIGVDGRIAEVLRAEQARLVAEGLLEEAPEKFCAEAIDGGRGWFYNHHDHMHITAW